MWVQQVPPQLSFSCAFHGVPTPAPLGEGMGCQEEQSLVTSGWWLPGFTSVRVLYVPVCYQILHNDPQTSQTGNTAQQTAWEATRPVPVCQTEVTEAPSLTAVGWSWMPNGRETEVHKCVEINSTAKGSEKKAQ